MFQNSLLVCAVALVSLVGCQSVNTSSSYTSFGRVVNHSEGSDGLVIFPNHYELPQHLKPHPNDKTVSFHYQRWLNERNTTRGGLLTVAPSNEPSSLSSDLKQSNYLTKHLSESNVLSYLYYEKGVVIYDAVAPAGRYGFDVNNQTELRSNSIGKSFVSYILGHAICEGYISSVDETLETWPLLEDTLYARQPLINLLNMRAGDYLEVHDSDGLLKSGRWYNSHSISDFASNELRGTKPAEARYSYNGLITNVIMNYVAFKTGEDWTALLGRIFTDKVGLENRLIFQRAGYMLDNSEWYSAYATRYDYLRIARAMMADWQQNTCVGQYLKEVYERRQDKSRDAWAWDIGPREAQQRREIFARRYGGQFHFDYPEMEDRPIIGMDGYGGQSILIDPSESRIIVINAAHTNYNWYELMYKPMRYGNLRD